VKITNKYKGTDKNDKNGPKTGDDNNILFYLVTMIGSMIALAGIAISRRNSKA
jgi:LPXTG-motif cell wall-anchored protein